MMLVGCPSWSVKGTSFRISRCACLFHKSSSNNFKCVYSTSIHPITSREDLYSHLGQVRSNSKSEYYISIRYHLQTALPVIQYFSDTRNTTKSLACVTDNNNGNLLSHENNLFSWRTLWEYLGFQIYQRLGRTGITSNIGIKLRSTTINPQSRAACKLGKQERTPRRKSLTDNHNGRSIKFNNLNPGDPIFFEQYKSCLEGHNFNSQGHSLSNQKNLGSNLLCGTASGKVTFIHLVGITGTETFQAKLKFDQEDAAVVVPNNK